MASITKKGDGKYLIRVSKGTGKSRTYINKTFRGTLARAREFARDKETLLNAGLPTQATLTFGEHSSIWLGAIKSRLAPLTYDNYEGNLRRHAGPINPLALGEIRAHHIQAIYNKLSTAVALSLHATLNACFSHAVRKEYLASNPCKHTDRPKRRRPSITVLSPDEARIFVNKCRASPHGLIFELALETGLRPEEYLALRWSDLHDRELSIEQIVQYNRKGGGFYFATPKTDKSRRRVSISENLRLQLVRHRREQNEHRLALKGTWYNHALIFPNVVGHPQTLANLTHRYFAPIIDACGFAGHLTLYGLRHSCATLLLIAGINPKVVADRLGHSSIVLTLDTYSHVLPGIQAAATEAIDRIMRGKRL